MKPMLAWTVVALTMLICSNQTLAASPELRLEHRLTGVAKGDAGLTLNYSLHLTNLGSSSLSDLTLSLVPRSNFIRNGLTVKIGDLGPGQDATFPLQVVAPLQVNPRWADSIPLSWRGKYLDPDGKTVVFPAVSKGGAR